MSSLSKRHFTAVVNSKEHGIYNSLNPSSAARKIVSKLCTSSKSKKVEFCVRETTQGSKKKTYGPYIGEMKKLVKPIELNGRIIQYAPKVHLKKKSSTAKSLKKMDKKIRGGKIESKGKLSDDDFEIDYDCGYEMINLSQYGFPSQDGYKFNIVKLNNFLNKIPNYLLRTVSQSGKQFIFFKKKIYNFKDRNVVFQDNNFIVIQKLIKSRYEYVAFEEKNFLNFLFKNNVIFKRYASITSYPEIQISEIPIKELLELIEYIDYKRNEYNSNQQNKDNVAQTRTYRDYYKRNEYNSDQQKLNPSSCIEIYNLVKQVLQDDKYLKNQSTLQQLQYLEQRQYQHNLKLRLPNGGILGRA